jgi:hypothetical protein
MDLTVIRIELSCSHYGAHIRLNSPVPIIFPQERVLIEEPTVPSTHVMIADHPTFANSNSSQIFEAIHKPIFINPFWK